MSADQTKRKERRQSGDPEKDFELICVLLRESAANLL
jgi:hypothetical protein